MNTVTWILQIFAAMAFGASGLIKLTGPEVAASRFVDWGYPAWLVYVVAAVELLGAAGLLIRKTVRASAGMLILLLLAAIYTHFTGGDSWVTTLPALLLLLIVALIAILRRQQFGATSL